jgi:hypothetical protein
MGGGGEVVTGLNCIVIEKYLMQGFHLLKPE